MKSDRSCALETSVAGGRRETFVTVGPGAVESLRRARSLARSRGRSVRSAPPARRPSPSPLPPVNVATCRHRGGRGGGGGGGGSGGGGPLSAISCRNFPIKSTRRDEGLTLWKRKKKKNKKHNRFIILLCRRVVLSTRNVIVRGNTRVTVRRIVGNKGRTEFKNF